MKSIFLTTFLALLTMGAYSQRMASQLQSKTWYVTGKLDGGSNLKLSPTAPKAHADFEAKFSSTGSLYKCNTLKENVVDPTGIEVKSGTYYCDSITTNYKIKNDVININALPANYYYRIKTLPNSEGIELTPATADDFK
jgi:hypothetical protein